MNKELIEYIKQIYEEMGLMFNNDKDWAISQALNAIVYKLKDFETRLQDLENN